MKWKTRWCLVALALLLAGIIATGAVLAQGALSMAWSVIGGGGGHAEGGAYTLDATIGQPVAAASGGGPYTLCAGFWCTEMPQRTMLPVMLKAAP